MTQPAEKRSTHEGAFGFEEDFKKPNDSGVQLDGEPIDLGGSAVEPMDIPDDDDEDKPKKIYTREDLGGAGDRLADQEKFLSALLNICKLKACELRVVTTSGGDGKSTQAIQTLDDVVQESQSLLVRNNFTIEGGLSAINKEETTQAQKDQRIALMQAVADELAEGTNSHINHMVEKLAKAGFPLPLHHTKNLETLNQSQFLALIERADSLVEKLRSYIKSMPVEEDVGVKIEDANSRLKDIPIDQIHPLLQPQLDIATKALDLLLREHAEGLRPEGTANTIDRYLERISELKKNLQSSDVTSRKLAASRLVGCIDNAEQFMKNSKRRGGESDKWADSIYSQATQRSAGEAHR